MTEHAAEWVVFAALTVGTIVGYWTQRRYHRHNDDLAALQDPVVAALRNGRPVVLPNDAEIKLVTGPIPESLAEIDGHFHTPGLCACGHRTIELPTGRGCTCGRELIECPEMGRPSTWVPGECSGKCIGIWKQAQ